METQTVITYEVVDPASNRSFITKSRDEAIDWYKKGHSVYETHTTTNQPSDFTQTRVHVTVLWNDSP